jgi:SAM-dependent methyltransferase
VDRCSMALFDPAQYWEARLSQRYDLRGVGFAGLGLAYNRWLYTVRERVFHRLVNSLRLDLSTLSILDLGSGTGFYIEQWNRLGAKSVTGVDITTVAVNNLRKRFPANAFVRADIAEGFHAKETHDVISAFDVLFHIVDDERFRAAIENIYKALRPGGLFIFSDNFIHHGTIKLEHQVSRSLESIQCTVIESGFMIDGRIPMFAIMNSPVDSQNKVRHLLWRGLTRVIKLREGFGFAIGALLYPLEILLTKKSESASTEIMVCRKPGLQ